MEFHRGVLMSIKPEWLDVHWRAAAVPSRVVLEGSDPRAAGRGQQRGAPAARRARSGARPLAGEGQRLIGLGRLP